MRYITPNITQVIQHYSDAQLARLLRYGVRPDGTSVVIMPSSMFYNLTDEDLADLIAYLRTVPPVVNTLPSMQIRILGRWLFRPERSNLKRLLSKNWGRAYQSANQHRPSPMGITWCTPLAPSVMALIYRAIRSLHTGSYHRKILYSGELCTLDEHRYGQWQS